MPIWSEDYQKGYREALKNQEEILKQAYRDGYRNGFLAGREVERDPIWRKEIDAKETSTQGCNAAQEERTT